jgi:short-subunit dehydrogenase
MHETHESRDNDQSRDSGFFPYVRRITSAFSVSAVETVLAGGGTLAALPLRQRFFGAPTLDRVLNGKTVLISGASSGIGRAVAFKLAETKARVVLVARSLDKLRELKREIDLSGGHALVYAADLSSGPSVDELLARLAADGVAVDVLVNNAGRSIRRSIDHATERVHDYERTMALNYFGSLRLILGLLPGMRARKSGHVINVSSSGVQMATPLFSAYVASKAALDAFTRVAAGETRDDQVRFSTVHMPLVRTPMIAPTDAYRDVEALSPEQAADLVLRPLITHEKQLGTRLANLFSLAHIVAPEAALRLISFGHRRGREASAGGAQ